MKFLLFLSLGVGILYLVYRHQNKAFQEECGLKGIPMEDCSLLAKVVDDFAGADYFWILMVLAAFTVSNVSRAIRWNMLLRPLGFRPRLINAFLTTVIGYFANLGLPRIGEVVRAGTMAQNERIPVEKVMGTIVVDRIFDVLSILIVTALAFLLQFKTIWTFVEENVRLGERAAAGVIFLYMFAAFTMVGALFFLFRKRISQSRLFQKIVEIAKGFWQGILTVRRLERPWLFLLHSINIWLMYYLMTYLCFFAFQPTAHLGPMAALVVFVFGGWGVVIPSPGGMGTYHFLAQTALQMYGVSGDDGFSWANISFFSIQLGCNVLIGILALIFLPAINRNYFPENIQPALEESHEKISLPQSEL